MERKVTLKININSQTEMSQFICIHAPRSALEGMVLVVVVVEAVGKVRCA
ncbi:hypothetical protein E2C01_083203 [Portunus trituberculatus]|uniref:Uncharacterized protein n=1 Tax=Portunus trituberculatus TaxID=210409 RepID=A0A5B7IWL3_PORTR|nr:hypothetical protein [Portunus trituberculatus]